jgi:hypothetical protein
VVLQVCTKLIKTFRITPIDLEEGRLIGSFGSSTNQPGFGNPVAFCLNCRIDHRNGPELHLIKEIFIPYVQNKNTLQ